MKYSRLLPWAIILAGAMLRSWNINRAAYWYDESFSLLLASLPPARLLAATAGDVHPPAYYMALAALVPVLGPAALRWFSVGCSVAALALAWRVSGLLGMGRAARLAGLAMLAAAPMDIYYAGEGRQYAALGLLVLGQCWALLRGKWWLLGLLTLAGLYTHNYSLFYTALLGLAGLVWHRKQWGRLVLAMGLPGVLFLPWVAVLAGQMGTINGNYWIPPITPGGVVIELGRAWLGDLPGRWALLGVPALAGGLVLAGRAGIRQKRWLPMLLGFGPAALAVGGSLAWQPILLFRGLVPSLPALAMLAGEAFTGARGAGRVGRWLVLLPWLVALGGYIGAAQLGQRAIYNWPMVSPVPAGSLVVHLDDTSYVLSRANWGSGVKNVLLDAGCPGQPGQLSTATRAALGVETITPAELPSSYYFAGLIGPVSDSCHEQWYYRLSASSPAVFEGRHQFGQWGIYKRGQQWQ